MIAVTCSECGKEQTELGALLFSPPNENSSCHKAHVCVDCYHNFGPRRFLEQALVPAVRDVMSNRPGSLEKLSKALTAYDRLTSSANEAAAATGSGASRIERPTTR
jgi:hypothetical protein